MKKYHFNIRINIKDNNAGSKATEDCRTILISNGFNDLEVSFVKVWYLMPVNFLKLLVKLLSYLFIIERGSFVLVQYPLLGINIFFKYYIQLLKIKKCKVCAIIHDVDCLRYDFDKSRVSQEMENLMPYDAVISHNPSMTKWLKQNGYKGHIEAIFLFDYLAKNVNKVKNDSTKFAEIAFAGNLARGTFLNKLSVNSFDLNLFGPGFNKTIAAKNSRIKWFGSFSPLEILNEIKGKFGLIWDGDSTEEITGLMGNYIRYNTPHKTSLYLASGLPVIISKNAALAPFIEENNIGICINSLSDIQEKAFGISAEEYAVMKSNATLIGEKLRRGDYLTEAVRKTQEDLKKR